jgi:hypothetical protein
MRWNQLFQARFFCYFLLVGFEVTKIIKLLARCMILSTPGTHRVFVKVRVAHLSPLSASDLLLPGVIVWLVKYSCVLPPADAASEFAVPTTHLSLRVLRTACERGAVRAGIIYLMKREVRGAALGGDWLQPPESIDTFAPHRTLLLWLRLGINWLAVAVERGNWMLAGLAIAKMLVADENRGNADRECNSKFSGAVFHWNS